MSVHTPIESRTSGIPAWALYLTALVLVVGAVYLAANFDGENPPLAVPGVSPSGPPASSGPDPAVGQALINSATPACTACHGADLAGSGPFPSLHGLANGPGVANLADLAAAYPDTWMELWIDGTTPETEGIDRGGMPAFGDQFSADQIASIVAYLKTLP